MHAHSRARLDETSLPVDDDDLEALDAKVVVDSDLGPGRTWARPGEGDKTTGAP